MHSEITTIEKQKLGKTSEIEGQSFLYMFLFYLVSALVIISMIIQYITISDVIYKNPANALNVEMIATINGVIPYENLVYSLIIYALATFGIEGTRSVIMNLDLTDISEKAKNMPRYKRNRLIQMLFTFIIIAILGGCFQISCINNNCIKADFKVGPVTSGIGILLSLLAYSDFAPKLSKQIIKFTSSITKKDEETADVDKSDKAFEEEEIIK